MLGFALVRIVGIDPKEAEVGNLVIKIHHIGFDTQAQVWIKIRDGVEEWINIAQF